MTDLIPPDGEFHTWSEIAGYLQISVREAQNREKDDGMPVHRLPGKKARVWALRSELDAWKSRAGAPKVAGSRYSAGGDVQPFETRPGVADVRGVARGKVARRTLLGLAGTAVAATGVASLLRWGHREPARSAIAGNSLCAWDDTGGLLWKYPFHELLRQTHDGYGLLKRPERQVQMVDFRGDGHKDIVVAAGFEQSGGVPPDREEVYCFSSDGKLQWRYVPQFAFTFGDTKYSGPWTLTDAILALDADGRSVVWLSVAHWNWRPSVLLTLGPTGNARVRFVSAGHIYVLYHSASPNGRYILAGGVNNEYASAALAVLRVDAPPSRSPQTPGTRFECVDGPKGFPDRYFLFPPSEATAEQNNPYNAVTIIAKSSALYVTTSEVRPFVVLALYRFSEDLEPVEVAFNDSFASWHRRAQAEGLLNHDLSNCPLLTRPTVVRRWDGRSGWTKVDVPPNRGVPPDSHR